MVSDLTDWYLIDINLTLLITEFVLLCPPPPFEGVMINDFKIRGTHEQTISLYIDHIGARRNTNSKNTKNTKKHDDPN